MTDTLTQQNNTFAGTITVVESNINGYVFEPTSEITTYQLAMVVSLFNMLYSKIPVNMTDYLNKHQLHPHFRKI